MGRIRRVRILLAGVAALTAACSSTTSAPPATTNPTGSIGGSPIVAPATIAPPPKYVATQTAVQEVEGAYRQGLARVGDGWIFSTNFALFRTSDDPRDVKVKNETAIPPAWIDKGYNHIGDVDVVDGVIYAPLEQPDTDRGRQAMIWFDATTLAFIDGLEVAQHHASFVTVDPATMTAYSMDFFGGDAFIRYDIKAGWKPLPPLPLSMFVDKVQGADIADGAFWLASDDDVKGLYRADQKTGQTQKIGSIGYLDGESEGIDSTPLPSGLLHVLSIDAKALPVRLLDFAVTTS